MLCVPFSDDEFLAVHAVVGASEGWEKSVSRVRNEWRVEKCHKFSFFPHSYSQHFPKDEARFVLKQRQNPQVTSEVQSDGSCLFRLFSHILATFKFS